MDNNELNWKVKKLADFGSSEPWVARIWMSLKEFADGLGLKNEQKVKVNSALDDLFTALSITFISLRNIERFENDKETPGLFLTKEYHDFYDKLWTVCKDRFQIVLLSLGIDVGFYFQNDRKFEEGLNIFIKKYSLSQNIIIEMIQDRSWIGKLQMFRNNYLQHKSVSSEIEKEFFKIEIAKTYFDNVWTFIEDLSLFAMKQYLPPFALFQEIPEQERDPAVPRRYKIGFKQEYFK